MKEVKHFLFEIPTMDNKIYDVCIVGAGMIGSSAARHASQDPKQKICLIGPEEPQNRQNAAMFGAYYDAGRLTRSSELNFIWREFQNRSEQRYRDIEKMSGVNFYEEVGNIVAVPGESADVEGFRELSKTIGLQELQDPLEKKQKFPFLKLPDSVVVFFAQHRAGYINPRELVKAQQRAAHLQGCDVIRDVVDTVIPVESSKLPRGASPLWRVVLESGAELQVRAVLLTPGAYTNMKHLLAHVFPTKQPHIIPITRTIVKLEVDEEEAHRLRLMPSMITDYKYKDVRRCYILPPIKYPDGKFYLKLGHSSASYEVLTSLSELTQWYRNKHGDANTVHDLTDFMRSLLPGLQYLSVQGEPCVVARTPSRHPYIEVISPGLGVAIGGNGYAAKSCDELGRLAARLLMHGEWDSAIPQDQVKVHWKACSQL